MVGTVVYIPCQGGVEAIQTSPSLSVRWQAVNGDIAGPPIAAGGLVWSIDQGGTLSGLNPANGATVQQVSIGSVANHFRRRRWRRPAPGPGDDQVYAFSGSAGLPGPPSPAPPNPPDSSYWLVASDGGVFNFGNAGFYGSTGSIALSKPVIGMADAVKARATGWWPPTGASSTTARPPSSDRRAASR